MQLVTGDTERARTDLGPAISVPLASEVTARLERVKRAAADPALEKAREQVPPVRIVFARRDVLAAGGSTHPARTVRDPLANLLPLGLRDDAPRLVMLAEPLGLGALEAPPGAFSRLSPRGPVPDALAPVEFVSEHLANRARRPRSRAIAQAPRSRRRDPFGVEALRDRLDAVALNVESEDAQNDLGCVRGNHEARISAPVCAGLGLEAIAVGGGSRGETALELTLKTAACVRLDLPALLRVHHAHNLRAEAREFLPGRNLEAPAVVLLELVHNPAEVLLIACDAGGVEAQQHVPIEDFAHEREEPWSVVSRCAGDP